MGRLLGDDPRAEAGGVLAAGEAEHGDAVDDPASGARGDDPRPDLVARARTEQFTEARQLLPEQRPDRLDRHVVGCHARAAGGDDAVDVLATRERVDRPLDRVVLVGNELARRQFVVRLDGRGDGIAGRIVVERPRGRDRDDGDADRPEVVLVGVDRLVLVVVVVIVVIVPVRTVRVV